MNVSFRCPRISGPHAPAWIAGVVFLAASCAHSPPRFDARARPTCLVLSVGGAAGVAHIGAIQAIQAAHLSISCVIGNSMGALVGSLYASAPQDDPDRRFRAFGTAYRDETQRAATRNGLGVGLLLGGLAALGSGGVAVPALAALSGFALGVQQTATLDRDRLVKVLDGFYGGARIESLPVPYVTFFYEGTAGGVELRTVKSGNLAQAVGASVANPLLFRRQEIAPGQPLDPGADRVSATPIEDACRLFPGANLLAINASGHPSFVGAGMTCPLREVVIHAETVTPDDVFAFGPAYERTVATGRDAASAALR